jgi:hypothetical protein
MAWWWLHEKLTHVITTVYLLKKNKSCVNWNNVIFECQKQFFEPLGMTETLQLGFLNYILVQNHFWMNQNIQNSLHTILFAYDHAIMPKTELQHILCILCVICHERNFKISTIKTKSMAFKGNEDNRLEIMTEQRQLLVSCILYKSCWYM